MVSLYFGLPGCGKTTLLSALALKASHSSRYVNIYCNVDISVPGVTFIPNECIGRYDLSDCLILIDEATLYADSRDFKSFDKSKITYFLEHRHFNADIILFTQQWDGVDRKIRVITDRVYHVTKGLLFGKWITRWYRIPYDIIIPDPKRYQGEKLGDIVQGYCKPSVFNRIFCHRIWRPKYYKYFDSWEKPYMPALPLKYQALPGRKIKLTPKEKRQLRHKVHKEMLHSLWERSYCICVRLFSPFVIFAKRLRAKMQKSKT